MLLWLAQQGASVAMSICWTQRITELHERLFPNRPGHLLELRLRFLRFQDVEEENRFSYFDSPLRRDARIRLLSPTWHDPRDFDAIARWRQPDESAPVKLDFGELMRIFDGVSPALDRYPVTNTILQRSPRWGGGVEPVPRDHPLVSWRATSCSTCWRSGAWSHRRCMGFRPSRLFPIVRHPHTPRENLAGGSGMRRRSARDTRNPSRRQPPNPVPVLRRPERASRSLVNRHPRMRRRDRGPCESGIRLPAVRPLLAVRHLLVALRAVLASGSALDAPLRPLLDLRRRRPRLTRDSPRRP